MNRTPLIMIGSLIALVAMLWMLSSNERTSQFDQPILFCAASNRAVIEEIRADYLKEHGRNVLIQYGASHSLLSQIEETLIGDLYLPADDSYLALGREKGLIDEQIPIARMNPVVAVAKENPKAIETFQDLLREDVRTVQANPDAAAIGKLTRKLLTESGLWQDLDQATNAYRDTVTSAANDLLIGAADAAIVYDAVLHTYPDLEFVKIPELEPASAMIAVGVIRSTKQPQAALHFARYLSAHDRGLQHYERHGFEVSDGDQWSDVPELRLYAGSMLRPAIESTVKAFQQREGVNVHAVYNGCGILVENMRAMKTTADRHAGITTDPDLPDAYFACDAEFMDQVPDIFPESVDVSENELVILVEKGNPHQIASLQDLSRPGIRVGVGHEKECAMGWLTQNALREGGIQKEVMANVQVQSSTGDLLVNKLKARALDAAVVYLSDSAGVGDSFDAVRIQGLDCSIAVQPFAIRPDSPNGQTASRLFQQICSSESKGSFAAQGFRWKFDLSDEQADD